MNKIRPKTLLRLLILGILAACLFVQPAFATKSKPKPKPNPQKPAAKVSIDRLSRCRADYLKAMSLAGAGKNAAALSLVERLSKDYPEMDDHILALRMDLLHDLGRHADVIRLYESSKSVFEGGAVEAQALLYYARCLLDQDRNADAVAAYESLLAKFPDSQPDLVRMRLAAIHRKTGDFARAERRYREIVWFYPTSGFADDAEKGAADVIAEGCKAGHDPAPEDLLRAIDARKKCRHSTEAAYCRRFLELYPGHASAGDVRIELAEILADQGLKAQARDALDGLISDRGPNDDLEARAAYLTLRMDAEAMDRTEWRSRILEIARKYPGAATSARLTQEAARSFLTDGNYAEAAALFSDAAHHPKVENAADALWMGGWSLYLASDFRAAAGVFDELSRIAQAESASRAAYWSARARLILGERERAIEILIGLAKGPIPYYYVFAARFRLAEMGASVSGAWPGDQARKEPSTVEKTLDGLLKEKGPARERFIKAREFFAMDLAPMARKEVDLVEATDDPDLYFSLALLYQSVDEMTSSVKRAARALELYRDKGRKFAPGLEKIWMPVRYWKDLQAEAKKAGLDPYLVAGLIRQESAFNPQAVSCSDARGLMQVLPSTGRYIAKKKGVRKFNPSQLYDPLTSLSFGTWYLRHNLDAGGNDLVMTIASYNAGPGKVRQWMPRFEGRTYDEAVEMIPFSQTRDYVKLVMRNREIYRALYGEGPSSSEDTVFPILGRKVRGSGQD